MRHWRVGVVAALLALGCGGPGSGEQEADALGGAAVTPGGPGPWPTDAAKNYSSAYGIGSVQSVGVDDALNVWLLDGARIGILRPGESAPRWSSNVGQAAQGFGSNKLATGSSVICGGTPGRAYVGYLADELSDSLLGDVNNPEYKKGDLDVVKLTAEGTIALETHLSESAVYQGKAQNQLGVRNTNDWRYDEDRSVLVCRRLRKGPNAGDLFIGTNHGVTMIRGTVYNSHRHPVWDVNGSLRIGYNFALGSSFDGTQVLMGNEWKLGILKAPGELTQWDRSNENPWIVDTYAPEVNSLEQEDNWRGFAQTKDGSYYLSSARYGLWKMTMKGNGQPAFSKMSGLPTDSLGQLEASEDGALFVATDGAGLWKLGADGKLAKVKDVAGNEVKQLVYEPRVSPPMLFVLTDAGLTVLR